VARGRWTPEAGAYHGGMLPDYAEFEQAMGLDWYRMDPNLSFLLDHYLPDPADRAFAEDHVARFGSLVGQVIAPRAEETDKHGPALRRYDRWGGDVDEIVHNASWTENKADLVRNGSSASRPTPAERLRPWWVPRSPIWCPRRRQRSTAAWG